MILLSFCVLAQQERVPREQRLPSPRPDLREAAYRVEEILESCPRYQEFDNATYKPRHLAAILHLVDQTMRRLQAVPTPVLTEAVRIMWAQSNDNSDPEYVGFEAGRLRKAPWLARLSSSERHTRLDYMGWWLAERTFYIDRFLFAAPEGEPFTGSAIVYHSSAFNAIKGHVIDRAYSFHFVPGGGVSLTPHFNLDPMIGGGRYPEILEYLLYVEHYPRRKRWWSNGN